jgi:2-polyprenyl-3-methyl-5-hydroxy-6-metoxy-1,4-benzoquinol methylase
MTTNEPLTDDRYWQSFWQRGAGTSRWVVPERHHLWGRRGSFIRVMRRHVPRLDGLSVVELGGASSHFLLALAKWCDARATAIDFSAAGLDQLADLFRANGLVVDAVLGDIFEWNPGRTFDLVVHWGLLEHFARPASVLAVCRGLLAPGGRVVFTMPNMAALGAALWKAWSPKNWATHIYHDDDTVRRACDEAGLVLRDRFHWGAPLIRMDSYERSGVGPSVAGVLQRLVNLPNHVVPCYHLGHALVSQSRGFVAEARG